MWPGQTFGDDSMEELSGIVKTSVLATQFHAKRRLTYRISQSLIAGGGGGTPGPLTLGSGPNGGAAPLSQPAR
jgi:hypothetical protein